MNIKTNGPRVRKLSLRLKSVNTKLLEKRIFTSTEKKSNMEMGSKGIKCRPNMLHARAFFLHQKPILNLNKPEETSHLFNLTENT